MKSKRREPAPERSRHEGRKPRGPICRNRRRSADGADLPLSGADQSGVRVYNERLMLSLVRRFGQLSKIEVARMTGLSVQSASTIMNRLSAEGLLKREAPLRGRVGQPTVPVSIDPEGAFSFGLKIGRRSSDLVLIDFTGSIRHRARSSILFRRPRTCSPSPRAPCPI